MFTRKPGLPERLHGAWWTFIDCAEVIEGGRRVLLATLPTGRVEPAPVAVGTDALRRAVSDARGWMPGWRIDEVGQEWAACAAGLDAAERHSVELDEVAASTDELEELLGAVQEVVEALDAFADAERAWRRHWRVPRERDTPSSPRP